MNIWTAIPLVSFSVFTVLAVLTLRQHRTRVNRTFAWFLIASGTWSFTSFMLHLNVYPQLALLWNELLVAALLWTVVSYYHFVRTYNNRPSGIGTYLGYAAVVTVLALSLNGYIVKYAYVSNGILYHDLGTSLYVIGGISAAFLIVSMLMLTQRYRSSLDPTDRNRTMYLIIGSAIVISSSYITNLTPAIAGLSIDHIGNLTNASLITYAIMRYQLLNIRFVAKRTLGYALAAACLGGIYVGAILLWQSVLPAQTTYNIALRTTALVLLLALMARPLMRRIENRLDHLFHRKNYEPRRALLDFSKRMSSVINLDELADEMLSTITKALHLTQAKLMIQDIGSGDFTTQFSYPKTEGEPDDEISFNVDNPVVTWLHKENEPLNLEPIDNMPKFKGLWEVEKRQIAASNLGMLCPIKTQGRLVGILALGKKRSGSIYSHEDLELAMNMASQAGAIINNAQLYSRAMVMANTDGLTELYNHRQFHERVDQEIARGSRFGTTFSLIMLDVDLFKAYNDIHGHLAGDEILRRIALAIRTSIRSLDTAFRYGGEEFAIILPEAQLADAYKVAERIRKTIASKTSSRATPITTSLGVASWPVDGVTKTEIITRADAALYRAKQTGRNRTCLSSEVAKTETLPADAEHETQSRALSIIYALAATVDAKDHYTYGHSKKVSNYAVALAEALGLSEEVIETIRAAGLLHDVGKIAVPDSTLNKSGPLNNDEWELIQAHPKLGIEILRHVIDLVNCIPIILHHHERYDGSGYPNGLKGDTIPLESRILAIADAFDAITSPRPYRKQLPVPEALSELKRCAGTQFDAKLVDVFCKVIESTPSTRLEIG
ncbi:MAG: diguanylate cyclase [Dehalococcoidales bacterium]|nr:diguanylate cyclase [Dehalococcoidales bacterium]